MTTCRPKSGASLTKAIPRDNILFQTPERAILWQNEREVLDADLTDPSQLVEAVHAFFAHRPQHYVEWEKAVAEFRDKVPALGKRLSELIHEERSTNTNFRTAFINFHEKCCQSLNPNLSEAAVEEMLIQHLLTVRIFRTVFDKSGFHPPKRHCQRNRNCDRRPHITIVQPQKFSPKPGPFLHLN